MSARVNTSLTVGFGDGRSGGGLSFETDETHGDSLRYAYARLYPQMVADTYSLQAIGGTIENLGNQSDAITETISFEGSREAKLKAVPSGNPTYGERTRAYDENLVAIDWPTLHCDRERGVVLADRPIWGWVRVEYQVDFLLIRFDRGQRIEASPYAQVAGGGGTRSNPLVQRVIAVSQDYGSAAWEVPGEPQREAEVYRVTSRYLVDADGPHEMPVGWPETTTYPDDTPAPNPDETAVVERVHEIGRVGSDGKLGIGSTTLASPGRWFPPYEADTGYNPAFTLVKLDASGDAAAAGQVMDWDSLQTSLDARFPGLALEGG